MGGRRIARYRKRQRVSRSTRSAAESKETEGGEKPDVRGQPSRRTIPPQHTCRSHPVPRHRSVREHAAAHVCTCLCMWSCSLLVCTAAGQARTRTRTRTQRPGLERRQGRAADVDAHARGDPHVQSSARTATHTATYLALIWVKPAPVLNLEVRCRSVDQGRALHSARARARNSETQQCHNNIGCTSGPPQAPKESDTR